MNIKPCIWPQCRSTNVSIIENKGLNFYYGFCFDCEAHGPSAQTPEQAAEAWNNRPGVAMSNETAPLSAVGIQPVVSLLPCPFCGSQPVSGWVGGDDDCGYWAVECPHCNGGTDRLFVGAHADLQTAAERTWNNRPEFKWGTFMELTESEETMGEARNLMEEKDGFLYLDLIEFGFNAARETKEQGE